MLNKLNCSKIRINNRLNKPSKFNFNNRRSKFQPSLNRPGFHSLLASNRLNNRNLHLFDRANSRSNKDSLSHQVFNKINSRSTKDSLSHQVLNRINNRSSKDSLNHQVFNRTKMLKFNSNNKLNWPGNNNCWHNRKHWSNKRPFKKHVLMKLKRRKKSKLND